jgi:hypothetical protein
VNNATWRGGGGHCLIIYLSSNLLLSLKRPKEVALDDGYGIFLDLTMDSLIYLKWGFYQHPPPFPSKNNFVLPLENQSLYLFPTFPQYLFFSYSPKYFIIFLLSLHKYWYCYFTNFALYTGIFFPFFYSKSPLPLPFIAAHNFHPPR